MKQGRWAIASLCVLLGMMLVFQFRTTRDISKDNISLQRVGDLTVKLEETEKQRNALEEELKDIKKEGTYGVLRKENERLRYRSGLTAVEGEGIIVTINDSKIPIKNGENANLYLIHDEDILKIINELKAAGAEAISINGQRLLAMTEVRCVGPTITINHKSFAPPYIVRAIGSPSTLAGALRLRGGISDTLSRWGIQLDIVESKRVVIPPYKGPFKEEYGKVERKEVSS